MSTVDSCGCSGGSSNGFLIVIVLYILLAIILIRLIYLHSKKCLEWQSIMEIKNYIKL